MATYNVFRDDLGFNTTSEISQARGKPGIFRDRTVVRDSSPFVTNVLAETLSIERCDLNRFACGNLELTVFFRFCSSLVHNRVFGTSGHPTIIAWTRASTK